MANTNPVRLQLSRARGARLVSKNGLPIVSVARPSRWGNVFSVVKIARCAVDHRDGVTAFAARWYVSRLEKGEPHACDLLCFELDARKLAVSLFRSELLAGNLAVSVEQVRKELAGKNLACWCELGQPCHADVLLCFARGVYS